MADDLAPLTLAPARVALADARAICPGLVTRPADLGREAAALAALRRWTARYSPMVAGANTNRRHLKTAPTFGGR